MKKIILLLVIVCLVSGCTPRVEKKESIYEKTEDENGEKVTTKIEVIKDNVFIAYTNDMFVNPESYKDKHIQIEGLLYSDFWNGTNADHTYVIRKTPGCCGDDGLAGIEISYLGELPPYESWVIARGVWKEVLGSQNGWALEIYSINVGPKGDEFLKFNY